MKKNMNIIIVIVGSIIMIFGIIIFLSIMEDDNDNAANKTVQIDTEKENKPSPTTNITKPTNEKDDGKLKNEQTAKDKTKAEQEAKNEQTAKDKTKAEQEAKNEQTAKDKTKAEQEAKNEQTAKDKAKAEQEAKNEQTAKDKTKAEQEAKNEQTAKDKAKAEQVKPNNTNKPSTSKPGGNAATIKPITPDPDEDYNAYLEAIGVDMNEPNTIEVIEGKNAERGDTLFDD